MNKELRFRESVYHSINEELHSKLCSVFHLTSNEARLYILMLQDKYYTASQLSKLSGINRSRIYDNLRGLEAKKLIYSTNQNPLKFKVLSPQEVVVQISQELAIEHQKELEEITALGILLDAEIERQTGSVDEVKPNVVPLEDAVAELRTLLDAATERVWVTKRTSGGVVDWFALRAELSRLQKNGTDIRFLSDRPFGFPFDLKVNSDVSLSFALIDDTVVAFLLPNTESIEGQLFVTQNTEYLRFFEQTFLNWWD